MIKELISYCKFLSVYIINYNFQVLGPFQTSDPRISIAEKVLGLNLKGSKILFWRKEINKSDIDTN